MAARTSRSKTKVILNITSFIMHLFINIIFYILVVLLVMKLSTVAYDFSYQIFGDVSVESQPGRDRKVQIKKGESTLDVSKKLELNKLIVNKYSFYLKAKITKKVIMPGTYIINSSMTYDEIFDIIGDLGASEDEETTE